MNRIAVRFGQFVFARRNLLAPLVFAFMLLATRPRPFLGSERWDAVLDIVGILVAAAGQALRGLVIGLAYIRRGGKNKKITADRLVCEGIFAHCRNPLYVGNFLLLTGILLIWNSPWAYLVGLPVVAAALMSMVLAEEAFLRQRFGTEYDEYCARVNRLVPNLRGLRETLAASSFDWRRVVRKDYGTTFTWISASLALIAVERVYWDGADAAPALVALAAIWAVVASLWGFARTMKKTGRLKSV